MSILEPGNTARSMSCHAFHVPSPYQVLCELNEGSPEIVFESEVTETLIWNLVKVER